MASARDVVAELSKLHLADAEKLINKPTGVVPGYHPELGGTVDEAGRLRYVGGGGVRMRMWQAYANTTNQIIPPGRSVIDFNQVVIDPPDAKDAPSSITTGADWAFTAYDPSVAVALVGLRVVVHANGTDWFNEGSLTLEWGATGSGFGVIVGQVDQYQFTNGAPESMNVTLHGVVTTVLSHTNPVCAYITNNTAADRIMGAEGYLESSVWILKLPGIFDY